MNDAKQTCQPSVVSAEFHKHVERCEQCKKWLDWKGDGPQPPPLCEEGRKALAAIFN